MYLRYERRRFLTALIATFIPGLLLIAGIYILYWIALAQGGTLILSYWLAALPAGLRSFFAILSPLDMRNALVFFARAYQPVLLLQTFIAAAMAGRSLTYDEKGLHELVFAMGKPRGLMFLVRLLYNGLYVLCLNILLFGAAVGGYCVFARITMDYLTAFGLIFLKATAMQCVFCAIGTMFSSFTRRSGPAVLWSCLAVLVLWLLGLLPSFDYRLGFLWYAALPHYALPEYALTLMPWNLVQGIVLGAAALVCILIAFLVYRRREFFTGRP